MPLLKSSIAALIFIFSALSSSSQSDTCNLRISLLTCGPGEDLYSIWGHTAIRVQANNSREDIIFNYGTFDFEDPDFYTKFTRGKLLYYVSEEAFRDFMYEYQVENRSVIEQELNLNCAEKERLFNDLRKNAKEENKYYRYEFLFDNCSTRPRDIITKNSDDPVYFKKIIPADAPTFRNMIHVNLDESGQLWSKFGIDLVLASRIDRKVKNEEAMFLPEYLMKGFDSSMIKNGSIVRNKKVILQHIPKINQEKSWLTPFIVTLFLFIVGTTTGLAKSGWMQRASTIFDITYFLLLGLMGCFMLFMWFGTEHELCRDNYNLLWALPSHLVMSFFIQKNSRFVKSYFAVTAALSILIIVCWRFMPQELNIAFLPLIALSGFRSAYRALKK